MPISHHLDLYRYWSPSGRSQDASAAHLDPCDIPKLLPYLSIVDKVDGQFRWRLVGTVVAREWARPDRSIVGSYDSTPRRRCGRAFMNAFSRPPIRSLLQASFKVNQRDREHVAARTAALR